LIAITLNGCGGKSTTHSDAAAQILLFNGTGSSLNDVAAIETILDSNHLKYSTATSSLLNGMSELQMRTYHLLIIPGGNFTDMGNNLSPVTARNIHYAVQHGLNYLGICAGGFLAGNSVYYNSLDLASGVTFGFYAAENQGIRKTVVAISSPGAPTLDQYWEDGPQFTGWGKVVGKYPDNTPAIVEGACGSGWVILTGIHAEAPEDWRLGMTFKTSASADNTYAGVLIRAALNKTSLPHY
jgi:glutamine amidotransferase-like uncharacterized protein